MTRVVTFKIDEILLERLNAFAISHRKSRSKVIKDALQLVFKKGKIVNTKAGETIGKLIPITFKFNESEIMKLDTLAIKYKLSRSALIRIAIIEYIKENDEPIPPARVEKIKLW